VRSNSPAHSEPLKQRTLLAFVIASARWPRTLGASTSCFAKFASYAQSFCVSAIALYFRTPCLDWQALQTLSWHPAFIWAS